MPTGTNEAKGHEDLSVGDVMTREVVTLDMNDSLHIADDVMSLGRIRHTPVLDGDGAVAGILSQRDLFRGDQRDGGPDPAVFYPASLPSAPGGPCLGDYDGGDRAGQREGLCSRLVSQAC